MIVPMRSWVRMTLTTLLVAVLPVGIVWALWTLGVVTSRWVAAPLVVGLALLASAAGAAYWKRRPATGDMLFRDLLLWGWLRRVRAERQLADAVEVLDRADADDEAGKGRLLKRPPPARHPQGPLPHRPPLFGPPRSTPFAGRRRGSPQGGSP